MKLSPDKYRNTYRHGMENVRDWCISRQLWWGQRIPAYYLPDGRYVVAPDAGKALEKARALDASVTAADLRQDPDVLDTWFSSWLWPMSVFDANRPGNPDAKPNADLAYYYPTNDLVTGPDILFFWVARMIMAGDEFMGDVPFRNVFLTGIVRDKLGRKMSKSLGNSPDPLDLIAKYGADSVRLGMMLCTSAGNDILFDESQVEQGRNFCNKVWNAYRLTEMWKVEDKPAANVNRIAVEWFRAKLSDAIAAVEDHYAKYRISDAIMTTYKLFWDDFCAWYLEMVKPAYGEAIDRETFNATIGFFEDLLKMLHPFMPFITEELWQHISDRESGATIMFASTPKAGKGNAKVIDDFNVASGAVVEIRALRQKKNISPKEALSLKVKGAYPADMSPVIEKMANISSIEVCDDFGSASGESFLSGTVQFFVPLEGMIDVAAEKAKIEAEIARYEGFLRGVNAKLGNERFVANAPEAVVAAERKKLADATLKLENLRERLSKL